MAKTVQVKTEYEDKTASWLDIDRTDGVVAIVGMQTSMALQEYGRHVSRTHAAATVTASLSQAMIACMPHTGYIAGCDDGTQGIPVLGAFVPTKSTLSVVVKGGWGTGNSGATVLDGTPLVHTMALAQNPPGDAKAGWLTTGAICDAVRGLCSGFGGCV